MFDISGKNTFITGGTSGIGLATAKHLKDAGANVTICGRRRNGHKIASELGVEFFSFDVTNEVSLKEALEKCYRTFGDIDFVFNNAGVMDKGASILKADTGSFRKIIETNLLAAYGVLHYAPHYMSANSSILITSSIAAELASAGYSRYSATKAAVSSLTKTAALEFASKGIRVNAIAPGSVWSEMLPVNDPEVTVTKMLSPFSRVGSPEDITSLVHFLMSDEARHITGSILTIDAGASAGLSPQLQKHIVQQAPLT